MALYHVHAQVIKKGTAVGGSAGFARYLQREAGHAEQHAEYLGRESHPAKDDLVAKGSGGLPTWAQDGTHFFQMADRYERGGPKRPGTVARCFEIALPRELSPEQRLELAEDMRSTFFEQYPHVWAIHNPIDRDGLEHPHMHVMLSERRQTDDITRGPKLWFSQAASPGQDPATHGVRKDRSWQGPDRLRELRAGVATLTNAALERAGVQTAVSHESLRARGHTRDAAVYTKVRDKAQVETERQHVHEDHHPWEQIQDLVAWRQQKAAEGIRDVSREAMVDHVRDRFWRHDRGPAREQERGASIERRILREHARTGRPFQGPRPVRTRRHMQVQGQRLTQQLAGLLRGQQEEEGAHGAPLHVRLRDDDGRERSRGIGF